MARKSVASSVGSPATKKDIQMLKEKYLLNRIFFWYVFAFNDWCFGHDADSEAEDAEYERVKLVAETELNEKL